MRTCWQAYSAIGEVFQQTIKNTLCGFLTFVGGAKLDCRHSSLACAFRTNKKGATENRTPLKNCLRPFFCSANRELCYQIKKARDGTRTRGPNLGKVVLYQLSHSRLLSLSFPSDNNYYTQTLFFCQHFFEINFRFKNFNLFL